MSEWLLLYVMHFVGDFVFQTDWQAKNKARNPLALFAHVGTYTVALAAFAYGANLTGMPHPFYWVLFNCVAHGITDAVTSQGTRYYSRQDPPQWHNFFVVVGADQCIHYCTLVASWYWLATSA